MPTSWHFPRAVVQLKGAHGVVSCLGLRTGYPGTRRIDTAAPDFIYGRMFSVVEVPALGLEKIHPQEQ